jgi:hypothetical protein
MKSWRLQWAGHVIEIKETRNEYKIFEWKPLGMKL